VERSWVDMNSEHENQPFLVDLKDCFVLPR